MQGAGKAKGKTIPDKVNVLLLGAYAVGKTSIAVKRLSGVFRSEYTPTVEEKYEIKQALESGEEIQVTILDTAGLDEYSTAMDDWIAQCDAYVLTYSITSQESFLLLKDLINQVEVIKRTKNVPMVMVGNKKDMENERAVNSEEAKAFANSFGLQLMEASARTGENVTQIFEVLLKEYFRIKKEQKANQPTVNDDGATRGNCNPCNLI